MNTASKYSVTTILILIYLLLPVTNFAHAGASESTGPVAQATAVADASPCHDCPSSGEQDSGCCDTIFCTCSCHTSLTQQFQHSFSPFVIVQRFHEPHRPLPQVYLSIFVPPQNRA